MKRRAFLNLAATGATLLATTPALEAAAKDRKNKKEASTPSGAAPSSDRSRAYVCDVCGHVEFVPPPEFCPVCHAEERFNRKDGIFSEASAKLKNGGARHTPVIRVDRKSTLISDVPCKQVNIRVGEIMHESERANHIHFIDIYLDDAFCTRFFASPSLRPAVVLFVRASSSRIRAVTYCSMHGFWNAEAPL